MAITLPENRQSEHSRITESLRRRIQSGDWAPGSAIPGRRHLAAEYRVSAVTLERAIVPLLADGTLRADDRRGTFVSENLPPSMTVRGSSARSRGNDAAPDNGEMGVDFLRPGRENTHGAWTTSGPASHTAPASLRRGNAAPGPVAIVASLYAPQCRDIGQNDRWVRDIVDAMETELAIHGRHTVFVNRVPRNAPEPVPLHESLQLALQAGGGQGANAAMASASHGHEAAISGLALISFDLSSQEVDDAYRVVDCNSLPVVSVVAGPLSVPMAHVLFDNRRAGYQAAEHLLERGYTAMDVFLPERAAWAEERLEGVRAAMRRAGLPPQSVRVLRGEDKPWSYAEDPMENAARSLTLLMDNGWRPQYPVICATDMAALVVLDMLAERGIAPGQQIPVLGFDDHELSRDAGLTSLRPPVRSMGKEAARLLLSGAENTSCGAQVRLCGRLIPRMSTATPAGSAVTPAGSGATTAGSPAPAPPAAAAPPANSQSEGQTS